MPSKFLRVKTAAVAGLALLSIGGAAAAATGLAPASAERAAKQASPRTPDGQVGHAQGDPLVAPAAQGRGRAGGVGDAAVAAAEHQHLDELVEHDAVRDALAVAAEGWWTWRVGSSAVNWSHRGSWMQDGIAGTRPPRDHPGVRAW